MSLTCESCDALLIDLVERELDETRAAEVRAHASGCEACGRALERLEGGRRAAQELVRAEPPRLDAVMAAARARAAEVRAAAAAATQQETATPSTPPVASPPEPEESWLERAMKWLGALATRPQVAMAALLVLMVGIGIFNLPQFRSHDGADSDGALVEPDVRAEIGPSALAPAEPLPLAVDPRTQRVALGGSEALEASESEHDVRPTTTIAQADEASEERHASPRAAEDTTAAQAAATGEEAQGPSPEVLAMAEIAPSDSLGRVEDGPLPEVAAAPDQPAVVVAPSPMPMAPRPSSPPPATATARTATRPPSIDEVEPPSTSVAAAMPAAILRQARALAAAGHCDEAVPRFRALLADHPDAADAPRAMIELAECDRRLGRFDDADRWLTRAEAFPSVSAEARRQRTLVATGRRASEHAVDQAGSSSSGTDVRAATVPSSDPAASSY